MKRKHKPDDLEITMGFDGDEFYVAVGNTRIAKRSDKAWISLVPGWRVETSDDYEQIKVWYEPTTPVSGRAN
jgi:hypothetical protein